MKSESLTGSRDQLDALISVVEEWHKLDPELTVNAILTFLHAARQEGKWTLVDIANHTKITLSTAGRSLQAFEAVNRRKEPGLDLIEKKFDPMGDARARSLALTRRGRAFVERMLEPLGRLSL